MMPQERNGATRQERVYHARQAGLPGMVARRVTSVWQERTKKRKALLFASCVIGGTGAEVV
tara:strand:- start:1148 stop:1330 length:183 start_codon:yes stop_codon:yes gene_type:complete